MLSQETRTIPHCLLEGVVVYESPPSVKRVQFLEESGVAQLGSVEGLCGQDWRRGVGHLERGSVHIAPCLF